MGVHILGGADAGQAGPDSAGHPLLQGEVAVDSLLRRVSLQGAQHGRGAAGKDGVRLEPVFPDSVQHISLCPGASVLGGHIKGRVPGQLLLQEEIAVPVARYDCLVPGQPFRQLHHGRHADAAADEEGLFIALIQREAVAQRAYKFQRLSRAIERKFLCARSHSPVHQAKPSALLVQLTDTDGPGQKPALVAAVDRHELAGPGLPYNIVRMQPQAIDLL